VKAPSLAARVTNPRACPYFIEIVKNGACVDRGLDGANAAILPLAEMPTPPYAYVAVPLRGGLPLVTVDVGDGETPAHRVRVTITIAVADGAAVVAPIEAFVVGKKRADGTATFTVVAPDGTTTVVASLAEAGC
jgi:hypothetical protein